MKSTETSKCPKVVFLGTPQVVVPVLELLLEARSVCQVIAVVTQPPARSERRGGALPSPVAQCALARGLPVLAPESARDPQFLESLRGLQPDLCVTAAYGNVLPESFLAIPHLGTVNIHPSLLPLYRGAAPVQRALEAGERETGVTVAFTVKAMDAGPIVEQKTISVPENAKAPELLSELFLLGTQLLIEAIPQIAAGKVQPREQDHARATHASKIKPEEGILDFHLTARALHHKVCAFAGWPGTKATFFMAGEPQEVKVITTRIPAGAPSVKSAEILLRGDALWVPCGEGSVLEVLELQPPGKRVLGARDFWNGLRTKTLTIK